MLNDGRWLTVAYSLLRKNLHRSLNLDGSEFSSKPKLLPGLLTHPCTSDVTSHCLKPAALSIALVSTAAPMSPCASGCGAPVAVQGLVPSYVSPVALATTGFLWITWCTVTVYVASAVASLEKRYRFNVALEMVEPGGIADRSNFITIALAIVLSGHV